MWYSDKEKRNKKLDDLFKTWFDLYFKNIRRDQFYFQLLLKKMGCVVGKLVLMILERGKEFLFFIHTKIKYQL